MKSQNHLRILLLWALLIPFLTLLPACDKIGPTDICLPSFQPVQFEENLRSSLEGQVMGFSFIVTRNGNIVRSGTWGKAQNGADQDINMSLHLEMQVASISKFITTVAAIRACRIRNIPLNTPIGQFLPSSWNRGSGINAVTIAELCNHSAGLNQVGTQRLNATRFDSLRVYVAAGATNPKNRVYSNTHHALLRVILPRLFYQYNDSQPGFDEEFVADAYRQLINQLVFQPIDAEGNLQLKDRFQILAYSGPGDNTTGAGGSVNFNLVSGGTGWHMTTFNVARVWAYAWFGDGFLTGAEREWLQTTESGMWNTLRNQKHGTYYCKLGGWDYTGPPNNKWVNSCIMFFPDGHQVTLFVNSPVPGGQSLRNLVAQLYDDSFGC
jgi:CubicO group peptidase (beta-lactamase class C family)